MYDFISHETDSRPHRIDSIDQKISNQRPSLIRVFDHAGAGEQAWKQQPRRILHPVK